VIGRQQVVKRLGAGHGAHDVSEDDGVFGFGLNGCHFAANGATDGAREVSVVDWLREDEPVSLVRSPMPFELRASNRAGVQSDVLVVAEHPIAPRTEDKYTPRSLW
jgi:hypothetical protein